MGIVIDLRRIGPPRFGLSGSAWQRVCELASDYDATFDWPDRQVPVPPRVQFVKYLVDTGRIQREDT